MVLKSHVSLLNYKLKRRGVIASLFFCLELFRTIVHFQQDGFTAGTIVHAGSWTAGPL
jgi:hypothetical protein